MQLSKDMPVTREEIQNDVFIVHEFIEYLRWLALHDPELELTAEQVWKMFFLGVRQGMVWLDVAEEVGIPENEDWK